MTSTEAVGEGREHYELESLRRVGASPQRPPEIPPRADPQHDDPRRGVRWHGRAVSGADLIVDQYGPAPEDLPLQLGRATLSRAAPGTWELRSEQPHRSWRFVEPTTQVFVHRPVATLLREAIPPRAMPLSRRLVWRAIPTLLSNPIGRRLLMWLR